jgi:hypothetical protein
MARRDQQIKVVNVTQDNNAAKLQTALRAELNGGWRLVSVVVGIGSQTVAIFTRPKKEVI